MPSTDNRPLSTLSAGRQASAALTLTRAMQLFQLLRLGSVILVSILLAKSSIGVVAIGSYEAMLFIGSAAAFFWANGLLQGMPALYARMEAAERSSFISNVILLFGAIGFILFLVLWLGQSLVVPALTGLPEIPHFGWYCLYLFFNFACLPVEYLYLLRDQPRALAGWGVFSFGTFVLALMLPVYAGYGLEGGLIGLAVQGAVRFVWAGVLVWRLGPVRWQPALVRRYLGFSAPLVLNLLVGNLVILFDSWLVGWYYQDESFFAIFRYGSRELPLATALATALGTALVARIAAEPALGLAELKVKTRRLFHFLFPVTGLLILVAEPLFPLVFSPAFSDSAGLFQIYLLLTLSRVLLPNAIVLAYGKPRAILVVGLIELAVKVALGFWFIQAWGLTGLAWSAVLAFFIEKIGLMWYLERNLKVRTADWLAWQWYLGYALALGLVYILEVV